MTEPSPWVGVGIVLLPFLSAFSFMVVVLRTQNRVISINRSDADEDRVRRDREADRYEQRITALRAQLDKKDAELAELEERARRLAVIVREAGVQWPG